MVHRCESARPRHRFAATVALLGLACAASCASLTPGEDDTTSAYTGQNTQQGVPTVASLGGTKPATASPENNTGAASGLAGLDGVGKASTVPGMSLRWRANPSRCLTRTSTTPTVGDPIVMANCASDARQAFSFNMGTSVYVSADLCLGSSSSTTSTPLTVVNCGDGNASKALGLLNGVFRRLLERGVCIANDSQGAVGSGVSLDPNPDITGVPVGPTGMWDVVGVGNLGGTLVILNRTDTTQNCLTLRNGTAAVGTCNSSITEQRWRMNQGALQNDNGQCLTCDMNSSRCSPHDCKTLGTPPKNDERWIIGLFGLFYRVPSSNYRSRYLLGDPFEQTAVLDPNGFGSGWTFGMKF